MNSSTTLSPERVREIAAANLGADISPEGHAPCPGAHLHTTPTDHRSFRLYIEPGRMPREHCFHASCTAARREYMTALYSAIRRAERDSSSPAATAIPRPPIRPAQPPTARAETPAFDPELTAATAAANPTGDWSPARLRAHSPIHIPAQPEQWAQHLLDHLYPPCSNILLFTTFHSQGDYLYQTARGSAGLWQLGQQPRATPLRRRWTDLPRSLPRGAWYLCAPVTGRWTPNPAKKDPRTGDPLPGRRHTACCTSYPYAVLESDRVDPATWLRILTILPERIAAVYTSGGKSIHTLIRVDARTPEEFKRHRARLLRLTAVGADPAAISAVRLTRLPGIIRAEKNSMQELLYLNPNPSTTPISQRPAAC